MKIINKYSIEAGLTVNEEKTEILSNYGEIIEKAWPMFKSKACIYLLGSWVGDKCTEKNLHEIK
ncbi:Hypothetical protein FKW44_005054, partial [Caligus rogercresseyi]